MKIVVDTNLLFSAVLKKESKIKSLLFNPSYDFYSCNFAFVELFKHKERLIKESKLNEEQIINQLKEILSVVVFVKEEFVPKEIFNTAYILCKDIDEKDTPFVALTMSLGAYLLTGDKKLTDGLKRKGFDRFLSPNELIEKSI